MRRLLDYVLVAILFAALIAIGALLNWIVSLNYDFFAGVFFTGLFWALIAAGRKLSRRN